MDFKKLAEGPMLKIPLQSGKVLISTITMWRGDHRQLDPRIIINGAEALTKELIHQEISARKEKLSIMNSSFLNKEYSLIINMNPTSGYINENIKHNLPFLEQHYFAIYPPNYFYFEENADHYTKILFLHREDREKMRILITEYYQNNFEAICQQEQAYANEIVRNLKKYNKITVNKICYSGKKNISVLPALEANLPGLQKALVFIFITLGFLMSRKTRTQFHYL